MVNEMNKMQENEFENDLNIDSMRSNAHLKPGEELK